MQLRARGSVPEGEWVHWDARVRHSYTKTILLDIAISLSPRPANSPSPSKMVLPHSWELHILSLPLPNTSWFRSILEKLYLITVPVTTLYLEIPWGGRALNTYRYTEHSSTQLSHRNAFFPLYAFGSNIYEWSQDFSVCFKEQSS